MIVFLVIIAILLTVLLCFSSLLQLLYLEALRLRTRDRASLQYFKNTLEDLIGKDTEYGATAFSLMKHTSLALLGVVFLGIAGGAAVPLWEGLLTATFLSWLTMLVFSYVIPQVLYRRTSLHWLRAFITTARSLVLITSPFAWFLRSSIRLRIWAAAPKSIVKRRMPPSTLRR